MPSTTTPRRIRPTGNLYQRVIPDGAVYVGRPTRWGNPHPVGKPCQPCGGREHDQDEAIELYRQHLAARPELVDRARRELAGHDLACWCPPGPCHADLLIEAANTTTTDPIVRCRYLRRNNAPCTAEAMDPEGDILICTKHAARVMAMIQARAGARQ